MMQGEGHLAQATALGGTRPRPSTLHFNPGNTGRRGKIVVISSVHDYRMARRGSIQALADALVRLGHEVTFVSIRFSWLSLLRGDSRSSLWHRANRLEMHNGMRCYLWRTALHPFNTSSTLVNALLTPAFALYGRSVNRTFDEEVRSASFIVVESGIGVMLLRRLRKLNPSATIIYRASDTLNAIGNHPAVEAELRRCVRLVNHVCLLAPKMAPDFVWAADKAFVVPLGVHHQDFEGVGPNPYTAPLNAVSVGGMLFDEGFFFHAASRFPNVHFHVIGSGRQFAVPENVHLYPEMPFKETLPFIKHATFGVAPYRSSEGVEYLSESSLKLMQYEYFGKPAVCPHFAAGASPLRFGYEPADPDSIAAAVGGALAKDGQTVRRRRFLSWDEAARRLLDPGAYVDTRLPSDAFNTDACRRVTERNHTLGTWGRQREPGTASDGVPYTASSGQAARGSRAGKAS